MEQIDIVKINPSLVMMRECDLLSTKVFLNLFRECCTERGLDTVLLPRHNMITYCLPVAVKCSLANFFKAWII